MQISNKKKDFNNINKQIKRFINTNFVLKFYSFSAIQVSTKCLSNIKISISGKEFKVRIKFIYKINNTFVILDRQSIIYFVYITQELNFDEFKFLVVSRRKIFFKNPF